MRGRGRDDPLARGVGGGVRSSARLHPEQRDARARRATIASALIRPAAKLALRRRYAATLPEKLEELRAACEVHRRGEGEAPLHGFGHRLAGSGASFGWPELTAVGEALAQAPASDLLAAAEAVEAALVEALECVRRCGGRRVLVLDEDGTMLETVRSLVPAGVRVARVASVALVRGALAAATYDVAVLPFVPAAMPARERLALLTSDPATAHVPILVVLPSEHAENREDCLAAGAAAVVVGADVDALRAALSACVGHSPVL